MKKLVFGLIVIVFFGFISNAQNISDIGFYHDEGLKLYYAKYKDEKINDIALLNKRIGHLLKEKYPSIFNEIDFNKIEELSKIIYGTNIQSEYNYNKKINELIQRLISENIVSKNLGVLISDFHNNNSSKSEIFGKIGKFKTENNITKEDKYYLDIFENVYNSSDSFWNSIEGNVSSSSYTRCNPRHQVRLADTMGGIFGAAFGAAIGGFGGFFGAAIGSNGMSALVEEMQEQHGGGCI